MSAKPLNCVDHTTGPAADINTFLFSTKYQDAETSLYNYGFRYMNPSTGRFLNRVPINERRDGRKRFARLSSQGDREGLACLGPAVRRVAPTACPWRKPSTWTKPGKENCGKFWTRVFRADLYVLFKIDKTRGSKVLVEVLGEEFDGVLGCDYFSAYHKYMKDFSITVQFCIGSSS